MVLWGRGDDVGVCQRRKRERGEEEEEEEDG